MKKLIIAMIAAASTMGAAQAQTAPTGYVGVGIASADHSYSIAGATNMDSDGYKANGKLFGGANFDQTWGLEAGYTHFGSAHGNYSIAGVPGTVSSKGNSVYLAGTATMPINEQFSVIGKLGASRNQWDTDTALLHTSDNKTELYGALGAQYNLSKQVALSLEWEHYGKNRDNAAKLGNVVTVAAKYNF